MLALGGCAEEPIELPPPLQCEAPPPQDCPPCIRATEGAASYNGSSPDAWEDEMDDEEGCEIEYQVTCYTASGVSILNRATKHIPEHMDGVWVFWFDKEGGVEYYVETTAMCFVTVEGKDLAYCL